MQIPIRRSVSPAPRGAPATTRTALLLGLLLLAGPHLLQAGQTDPAPPQPPAGEEPPPLYDDLGPLERAVSTRNPVAQRYVNQGIRLTYGFAHGEAVRSFREARRHDPACASCAWGEAWASGPNINLPMPDSAVPEAYAAARAAVELADGASPVERALIEAMATRYAPSPEAAERAALDSAYARAMDEVESRFPEDIEVLTLTAEAHMVLRPWEYWTDQGEPHPGVERPLELLERALALDLAHPGACHLYIHLVEASPSPERGEACAELLGDGIPGVSHILHMPSHIFMRIGRYGDAVRGNQRAWVADQRAAEGGAPAVYPTHNLHMLVFAASFDGQSAVAIEAARELADLSGTYAFYVPLALVRFGRWERILELPDDEASDFGAGVHAFARGLARLGTGDGARARGHLRTLEGLRDRLPPDARFRGHPQRDLLGIAEGTLRGELLAADGDQDGAVEALEAAVELQDGLAYDEPEPWTIPTRHHLGAVLLEGGRPGEAERVYRDALAVHPDAGWSLHGLAQALRAQGRDAEAEEARTAFDAAWARADVWITGSRY